MNKILAIVLFPIIWLFMYLYRIIWYDLVCSIIDIIVNLFSITFFYRIIILPIVLFIDIPVGFFVTFFGAISMCKDIFNEDIDISSAMKECFKKK